MLLSITDRFKQKHYFLHFYPHLECIIHVLNFTSFNNYGIQNPKEWFFNKESTIVYSHDFFSFTFYIQECQNCLKVYMCITLFSMVDQWESCTNTSLSKGLGFDNENSQKSLEPIKWKKVKMISILVKRNLIDKCSDYEHFFTWKWWNYWL